MFIVVENIFSVASPFLFCWHKVVQYLYYNACLPGIQCRLPPGARDPRRSQVLLKGVFIERNSFFFTEDCKMS